MKNQDNRLSGDRPLKDPKHDRLGYRSFALHLSNAICEMAPADGIVLSVYGPWGSGKTTLLNFVEYFIKLNRGKTKPQIVYFNPWWFSGSEVLVRNFFNQLISSLNPNDQTLNEIRETLSLFGEAVANAPLPKKEWISAFAKWIKPPHLDLNKLRNKLESLLRNRNKSFLIIIDDIDRLVASEICQLFSVIKAVTNLPNLIYLLAFQKQVVTDALSGFTEFSGEQYLEKIVQVPFDLPLPDKPTLRRLFFERVDESLGALEEGDFDQQYWGNVFYDGIDPLIETPRDITRLSNVIAVTFPVVRGEVNTVDFIAIETLRVFTPEIYHIIRSNRDEFTGSSDRHSASHQVQSREFHDAYINNLSAENREPIKALLQRLFPKLQAVWGNLNYGSDFESEWRRDKRVYSPDIFPVFFQLELPEGCIGSQDILGFLENANNRNNVSEALLKLAEQKHPSGTTRAHILLQRLEDYTREVISSENIEPIILGLFDAGDRLIASEPEAKGFFEFGIETQTARIIFQLLRRLNEDQRFSLLKKAVQTGIGLATVLHRVSVIGQMHGKYGSKEPTPEKEQLISFQQLEELEHLVAARVSKAAESGELLSAVDLAYILLRWRDWQDGDYVKKWIEIHEEDEDFIVSLLTSMLQVRFSHGLGIGGLGDRVSQKTYYINLKYLREFIDPERIEPLVVKILKNKDLEPRQKLALETFLDCYRNPEKYERY